jgi:hypothetical protein
MRVNGSVRIDRRSPMYLDITHMMQDDMFELSASVAERGKDAGRETWENSKAYAREHPLLTTPESLDDARQWIQGFGAWDREEITDWHAGEVNALVCQYIAGNIREIESLCMGDNGEIDEAEMERLSDEGTISGGIYRGEDGRWYFYMGE